MLEITVFLSGALVMVLEMVGGRVLAPHVGTSAVVWTSIIGVVLACLAAGSWAGGRFADRRLSASGLAQALAGAGAGCGLTALLHTAIGAGVADSVGSIHAAAVLAALGNFALPAFFFGMVTPYVVRLRLAGIDTAGATVGRLYALSTAGSILGTFLGGFVLISFFSSTAILWGVCVCMLLLAAANAGAKGRRPALLMTACAVVVGGADMYAARRAASDGGTRLMESPYNSIRIMEGSDQAKGGRPVRLMATDPGYSQSGMLLDAPRELYFEYTRFYALGPRFVPKAERVLMLGGGGYSVPKWLLGGKSGLDAASLRLTVVEIDSVMTDCARRWFALEDDPRMLVRHEDARAFLNRQREIYDLVFVDVFNSHYSVPFQMGTVEAARALRRAVAPGGALLMNVISAVTGDNGRLFRSIRHALAAAFPDVRVFPVSRPDRPDMIQNLMLLALPERGREPSAPPFAMESPSLAETEAMLASRHAAPIAADIPPLADDFAPVERYALMLLDR